MAWKEFAGQIVLLSLKGGLELQGLLGQKRASLSDGRSPHN